MNKIMGFIKLLRFELPFSAGVCVVMGQILALGEFASIPVTVFGFALVFLISVSILFFLFTFGLIREGILVWRFLSFEFCY